MGEKTNLVRREEKAGPLSSFKLCKEILEDKEFFAEVDSITEIKDEPEKSRVKFLPFENLGGSRCYFEPVYLTLNHANTPSSAAGQFIKLFEKANHLGDILNQVVGLDIRCNAGKDGRLFKNVCTVFEVEEFPIAFEQQDIKKEELRIKTFDEMLDDDLDELMVDDVDMLEDDYEEV